MAKVSALVLAVLFARVAVTNQAVLNTTPETSKVYDFSETAVTDQATPETLKVPDLSEADPLDEDVVLAFLVDLTKKGGDEETLLELMMAEDDIFFSKFALRVAKKAYLTATKQADKEAAHSRHRRQLGLAVRAGARLAAKAFQAARRLFKSSRPSKAPTRSGNRETHHYDSKQTHEQAEKDFHDLNLPDATKHTTESGGTVQTGTVGKHRVTVRSKSSEGSPTVEIRSPKEGNGPVKTVVRKFRLQEPKE